MTYFFGSEPNKGENMSFKLLSTIAVISASAVAFAAGTTATTTHTTMTTTAPAAKPAAAVTVQKADASAVPFKKVTKDLYKKTGTVVGPIVGTFCDDKMCFLNFDKDFKHNLSVVIMKEDFANFSSLPGADIKAKLDSYVGKTVQVTGKLDEYVGKSGSRPQIYLTKETDIKEVLAQ
jgi:hypothetical protein